MLKLLKKNKKIIGTVCLVLVLLVVFAVVGKARSLKSRSEYILATVADIEAARREVSDLYLAKSSADCTDASDPIRPADRKAVFYQYLRVNKYANRAVIRGCNNIDQLLARTKDGEWTVTSVNINLDSRAGSTWQSACLIDDITVADDQVRPENSTIDSVNLETCEKLKKL